MLKNNETFDYKRTIELLKSICPLANIDETYYGLAIKTLEKQIPKDVINKQTDYVQYCPTCESPLLRENDKYCSECGQRLKWD